MTIPILGQGPKLTPVEQFSGLLDVLCNTLAAAKVAADKTLPGSELAKALGRALTLKDEISPVLAGALDQVKTGERKRNREKAVSILIEKAIEVETSRESDAAPCMEDEAAALRAAASDISEALGGEKITPDARA